MHSRVNLLRRNEKRMNERCWPLVNFEFKCHGQVIIIPDDDANRAACRGCVRLSLTFFILNDPIHSRIGVPPFQQYHSRSIRISPISESGLHRR